VKGKGESEEERKRKFVCESENRTPLYIGREIKDILHLHNKIHFVVALSKSNLIFL